MSRRATTDELRAAYLTRVRALHPDAHPDATPEEQLGLLSAVQLLNEAWEVLSDPRSREEYDAKCDPEAPPSSDNRERRVHAHVPRGFEHMRWSARWFLGMDPGRAHVLEQGMLYLTLVDPDRADLAALDALSPGDVWGLNLAGAAVTDAQLAHVARLGGLRHLDLSDSRVTDLGLHELLLELVELEELDLSGTRVTDAGLATVSRLTLLRVLTLVGLHVTDDGLAALADLPRLTILNLRSTRVRGPGLVHLHGVRTLNMVALPRVGRSARQALVTALPGLALT